MRERWTNHLNPSLRLGAFSEAEDEALEAAVAELGTRWIEVSDRVGSKEGVRG